MISFYLLAALLIVLAIGLIAPSLWRGRTLSETDRNAQNIAIARERLAELEEERKQDQLDEQSFNQARLELEKTLAGDLGSEAGKVVRSSAGSRKTLAAIAVALPAITLALYFALGAPQYVGVVGGGADEDNPHTQGTSEVTASMDELLQRLIKRLEKNPDDPDGWFMLGRTYMQFENYPEAVKAYERLYALVGEHPVAMLALADAVAMQNGGNITGRPAELVQKSLALDPTNTTALWLAGMVAEEQGHYVEAINHWEKLLSLLEQNNSSRSEVQNMIDQARTKLSPEQAAQLAKTAPVQTTAPAANDSKARLKVRVALAPALQAQAKPDDVVFIYARAMEGMAMPLAAARHRVSELPLEVVLDDSMAMMPAARLSNFGQVRVGARISKSGQATAQSGDLIGELENISTSTTQTLDITIGRTLP